MADTDITHLEIHTGKTEAIRASTTAPTTPTVEIGDMYLDTSSGAEALGIYHNAWVYISTYNA